MKPINNWKFQYDQTAEFYRLEREIFAYPVLSLQNLSLGEMESDRCRYSFLSNDKLGDSLASRMTKVLKDSFIEKYIHIIRYAWTPISRENVT